MHFKNLLLIAYLDLKEPIRAKWFIIYALVFGGLIALFFIAGITESQVMGFSGLSRLLLMYIQVTIVILPIFILVTTVRSISGDRDNHILEYMLSFPISLKEYYWGKVFGRFITVFLPVFYGNGLCNSLWYFKRSRSTLEYLFTLYRFTLCDEFYFFRYSFFHLLYREII